MTEEELQKQIDEIQEVEKEIRAIAHNLNSNLFSNNATFEGIVKELFVKIKNHSQLSLILQVSDTIDWELISNTIKVNLFRIIQEALQNIEKYAQATSVVIYITTTNKHEVEMTITDDGIGFEPTKKASGIGLNNMKMRTEELNGTFTITSEKDKGTKINLKIKL